MCRKASQKLKALCRLCSIIPFEKRKMLMQVFFISQFSYSPLVWMFCSRRLNTKINTLHYRALRLVYRDETASFDEQLTKDGSVTIHHRNLQCRAIEMFKVYKGVAPSFMSDVFGMKQNVNSENVSVNTRSDKTFYCSRNPKTVNNGLETLSFLGAKIWDMIPSDTKNSSSVPLFKVKIRKRIPHNRPCRLCKLFVPQLGFL